MGADAHEDKVFRAGQLTSTLAQVRETLKKDYFPGHILWRRFLRLVLPKFSQSPDQVETKAFPPLASSLLYFLEQRLKHVPIFVRWPVQRRLECDAVICDGDDQQSLVVLIRL
jgi:hypothetical protein